MELELVTADDVVENIEENVNIIGKYCNEIFE